MLFRDERNFTPSQAKGGQLLLKYFYHFTILLSSENLFNYNKNKRRKFQLLKKTLGAFRMDYKGL